MFCWQTTPKTDDDFGQAGGFADQAEAEAWLTATYEELSAAGVDAVSLYDDGQLVYGPMSLDE